MASPSPNNRPERRHAKKALVQPVLPALPLLQKSAKARPTNVKLQPNPPAPLPSEESRHQTNVERVELAQSTGHLHLSGVASAQEDHILSAVQQSTADLTRSDTTDAPPQASALPQESDCDGPSLANGEELINEAIKADAPSPEQRGPPSPPRPATQLARPDLLYPNGTSQSETSASSVDYATSQPADTRGPSVNESQIWSEDANDSSQPTSLVHPSPTAELESRECDSQADAKAGLPEASQANEEEPVNVKDVTKATPWPPALSNGTVVNTHHHPPQSGEQLSLSRASSAASTSTLQIPSISEHLLHLATSKLWADWILVIQSSGVQPLAIYAHGILLLRSLRLSQMMNRQAPSQHTGNVINLYPPRSLLPHAFEAALRFLYSDTILSSDVLLPRAPASDARAERANALDYLLSYWASGIELGLEPVVTRSAHILVELLDWDTAEATMKEAIELDTACWRTGPQQAGVAIEYAAMALQLKQTVLNFLASHINPTTFNLNTTPTLSLIRSRFAAIEDNRRHNPALSSMVFGSMPSSVDLSPVLPPSEIVRPVEEIAASNILFNVDFEGLSFFYRQLQVAHGAAATSFLTKVIEERESRRSKVLSSRVIPPKPRTTDSETLDVAGYREFLDGGVLHRERVAFLPPTKSA
ncbi:hypothetical protein DV738_g4627, partial [Chaetothyriales sp. CBS 135597]